MPLEMNKIACGGMSKDMRNENLLKTCTCAGSGIGRKDGLKVEAVYFDLQTEAKRRKQSEPVNGRR